VCNQGTAEKQLSIADVVIPVEKSREKKKKKKQVEKHSAVNCISVVLHAVGRSVSDGGIQICVLSQAAKFETSLIERSCLDQ